MFERDLHGGKFAAHAIHQFSSSLQLCGTDYFLELAATIRHPFGTHLMTASTQRVSLFGDLLGVAGIQCIADSLQPRRRIPDEQLNELY